MPDKDIVLNGHAFADEGVAGDFAIFADDGVFLDLDEGADFGVFADFAAVEVDEVVDLDIFAEFYICGYLFQNKFTAETLRAQRIYFFPFRK